MKKKLYLSAFAAAAMAVSAYFAYQPSDSVNSLLEANIEALADPEGNTSDGSWVPTLKGMSGAKFYCCVRLTGWCGSWLPCHNYGYSDDPNVSN